MRAPAVFAAVLLALLGTVLPSRVHAQAERPPLPAWRAELPLGGTARRPGMPREIPPVAMRELSVSRTHTKTGLLIGGLVGTAATATLLILYCKRSRYQLQSRRSGHGRDGHRPASGCGGSPHRVAGADRGVATYVQLSWEHRSVTPEKEPWTMEKEPRWKGSGRMGTNGGRGGEEDERAIAEELRETRELGRIGGESVRDEAEGDRRREEMRRDAAEAGRTSAEEQRIAAEGARLQAEALRAAAEEARSAAEDARTAAEDARAATAEQRALMEELRRTMRLYEREDAS